MATLSTMGRIEPGWHICLCTPAGPRGSWDFANGRVLLITAVEAATNGIWVDYIQLVARPRTKNGRSVGRGRSFIPLVAGRYQLNGF